MGVVGFNNGEGSRPQPTAAVREFNRRHTEQILPLLLNATTQILEAIPPLQSSDSADTRELEAIDKPRRDRLDYLVELSEITASLGIDPSVIIEAMLPHTDLVFGTHEPILYQLRLANILNSSGRDASRIWEHAKQTADAKNATGLKAEAYALIGSSKANAGRDEDADVDFTTAIELLQRHQEEVRVAPHGLIGGLAEFESVMTALHDHGRWELLGSTLKLVDDEDLRSHLEDVFPMRDGLDLQGTPEGGTSQQSG